MNLESQNSSQINNWSIPPQDVHLTGNQVDIWLSSPDIGKSHIDSQIKVLSGDEIKRTQLFHSIELKNNFIAARALLRFILARYLNVKPKELTFHYDDNGKPSLAGKFLKSGICFNLSHSHETALYGITLKRAIGTDVEKKRTNLSFEKIARRQFAPSEFELFQKLPEKEKIHTFFKYWTRKESLLKALGKGLHLSMKKFDVSNTPGEPVRFLDGSFISGKESVWFIEDLDIGHDYCAAYAVEGKPELTKLYKATIKDFPG